MNMAESRPRPVPKPRTRQKSLPNTPADLVGCLSSNFSTSPVNKPPITKPKPHGYKTLDYNNQGLVSITADIDITDEPVSKGIIASGNRRIENNNNITNLNDLKKKNATSNVWSSEQEKTSSPLSESYTKPLPPLPGEACPVQNKHSLNVEVTQSGKVYNSSLTPPLPRKPPRVHPSASESHLESLRKNQNFSESSAVALSNIRNPPLPRKPTMLQRSSASDVPQASRNHLGRPSSKNNIDSSECSDISRTPSPCEKLNKESSSTASRSRLIKPVPSLVETKNTLSASNGTSNTNNSNDNIGRTPPLPRKPARIPSPALEIHSAKGKDSSDAGKNKKNLEQDSAQSRMVPKKLVKNPDGSRGRSLSPPTERPRPNSPKCNLNASAIPPSAAKGDMNFHKERPSLPTESTNSSSTTPEGRGTPENGIKHTHPRSLPGSTRRRPPEKPLPDLPSQDNASFSPPRRPPPDRPKQPSLKGSGKKSGPPPLPIAPRPKSVWQADEVKKKDIQRSRSVGNLIEDCNEDEYWVAYQHFAQQSPHPSSETGESNGGEYEDPDHEAVKGFMDSVQRKARNSQSKEKPIVAKQGQDYHPGTYSSSSDDSANEYEELDTPQKNENASLSSSTVSSSESHGYVEPIPFEERSEQPKKLSLNKETSTKKFEFKPFHDMDGEWSETKEIKWEYEGESDDSDAYVEPNEDEDDDDDDDDDVYELGDQAAEEPLYQIYQATVFEKQRTLSLKRLKKDSVPQFSPTFSGNVTLRTGTMRGGKMLWAQLPEVRNSGILENIVGEHRKLQEAIFEVVSSEASYLKSLNLLVDHFLKSSLFSTDSSDPILEINQVSELFSNIMEIVRVSESFLHDLRTRQRKSILIESISDIIIDHATNHFKPYVTYCSTQYKQDRMLANLKKTNLGFAEALEKLERDPRVCGLTLQSFLVLPMQRVTRYPLLVDAIVRRCEPGHSEYYKTDEALKAVNKVVHKCNEGARNEERHEEMLQIDKLIVFLKMKPIQLVTDDRWLLRRGPLQLLEYERKATLSNTLRGKFKKYRVKTIYLYLFNDFLVVTKKKSETLFSVIDFARRNMIRVQEAKSSAKNSFILVFLENFEKKTKELNVRADNETDLTRWREAFAPPEAETDDEKVYGTWDCPQFQAIHTYQAQQSDELSLVPGDVVNVLRKLPDGWYEGERIRDGMCGWFPANYTEEIRNEHVRARNLHQRYRLLAASTAFLDTRKR